MDFYKNSSSTANEPRDIEFQKPPEKSVAGDFNMDSGAYLADDFEKITPDWMPEKKRRTAFSFEHSVSALDVAAYILDKKNAMSTMKLQKLVYYSQAWSLVWDEKPLFKEDIEAWANGPVVRALFNYHRGQFTISSVLTGNPDLLNKDQRETIDAVLEFYGNKSSQWLSDLTHMEDPWKITRSGIPEFQRGDRIISLETLAEYYGSLPPNKD